MKTFSTLLLFVCLTIGLVASDLPRTPSPDGAVVYIVSPLEGAVLESPVTVVFGLKGMGVAPAGVDVPNTGHHHLLLDADALPAEGLPMPMAPSLIHFGKGQTETELVLEAGTHTLQLILGDRLHIPHQPPVISEKITITVSPAAN